MLINLLKAKKSFNDILIYILLGAGVMTAVLGKWIETCVILGVAVINAAIGFIQDGKAEQALEGIRKILSLNAGDGEWVDRALRELGVSLAYIHSERYNFV